MIATYAAHSRLATLVLFCLGTLGSALAAYPSQTPLAATWIPTVTEAEAQLAAQYYAEKFPPPDVSAADLVVPVDENGDYIFDKLEWERNGRLQLLAYIFNLVSRVDSSRHGFFVITADKRLEPLIAYSTEGPFPWSDADRNTLKRMLVWDIDHRLAAIEHTRVTSTMLNEKAAKWNWILSAETIRNPPGIGVTRSLLASLILLDPPQEDSSSYMTLGPLISFPNNWRQEAPYNAACPNGSLVGCVPLAMAQIIYHHQTPSVAVFDGVEPDKMPVTSFSYTHDATSSDAAEQTQAFVNIANICHAAGVSADTTYGFFSSDATMGNAAAGFRNSWGYRSAQCVAPGWGDATYSKFFQQLRMDMNRGLPSILEVAVDIAIARREGQLVGGRGDYHAVVCDGWQREEKTSATPSTTTLITDFFHLRVGGPWVCAGCNAWYHLPAWEAPTGAGLDDAYNVLYSAILCIDPRQRACNI